MASFKFLEALSSKKYGKYVCVCVCVCVWGGHLKIFPLYLLTRRVVVVLIIYKFLAYTTKQKIP